MDPVVGIFPDRAAAERGDVALSQAFQRGYARGASAAGARAEEIGAGVKR